MALSYTDMSRALTPRRPGIRPHTGLAGDGDISEAWVDALPSAVKSELQARLKSITLSLPAAAQIEVANKIVNAGHALPFGMPLDGLGCSCEPSINGLGQWAELANAISSIAVAKIDTSSASDIAKNQAAASAAIAKAQAQAAIAQAAIAQANALAASKAPMMKSMVMWGGISLTLIVGVGAIVLLRRSKKK